MQARFSLWMGLGVERGYSQETTPVGRGRRQDGAKRDTELWNYCKGSLVYAGVEMALQSFSKWS